jgi:hypothetical protein
VRPERIDRRLARQLDVALTEAQEFANAREGQDANAH